MVEKMLGIHKFGNIKMSVRLVRIFITFNIVNFSRLFFRMPTISNAFDLIGHIASDFFSPFTQLEESNLLYFFLVFPILLAVDVWEEFFQDKYRLNGNRYLRWAFYIGIVLVVMSVGVIDGGQFIYAKF